MGGKAATASAPVVWHAGRQAAGPAGIRAWVRGSQFVDQRLGQAGPIIIGGLSWLDDAAAHAATLTGDREMAAAISTAASAFGSQNPLAGFGGVAAGMRHKWAGRDSAQLVDTCIPDELHHRINLKGGVLKEYEHLKGMVANPGELAPALAGVPDRRTGKIYFGINDVDGNPPDPLSPEMARRLTNMPQEVNDSYTRTKGAGSHDEVNALNSAWLDRPDADASDFLLYVINAGLSGRNKVWRGWPMASCPHCEYLTDGVTYIPAGHVSGKNIYNIGERK